MTDHTEIAIRIETALRPIGYELLAVDMHEDEHDSNIVTITLTTNRVKS